MKDGLTVGRVAAAAGVTPDAVRYYERLRLLPAPKRSAGGYRVFDQTQLERIRVIKRAQSLGLSLAEIKALFPLGTIGRAECRRVRDRLAGKIADTDARMSDLKRFKSVLAAYLRACDAAIARGVEACPVLAADWGVSNKHSGDVRKR
ncbi:MAG: heavy metal-responsive transcriptional regulator [Candidatus Eremiobacteraeota bacterium]|nr:heavy metal-responsive transcriptional regulator [Candidatus Eremiobacteraeota bacterium]